ncbi:MAG: SDR family oxidoreductase, partial [Oscillospiraceae bacterium]|nr:SDR family oxidoreductase [Oscillospiraceae bacterium]
DILANNAGLSSRTSIYEYTLEEFTKIMDVNVKAVFVCSQAAARIMKEQGGGAIINTSSMVGEYGQPSGCAYPTSKFAVNGLTKSLARELAKDKIRVNAVAPGVTRTDMLSALPQEMVDRISAGIPLGRVGEPLDIANAYLFLASELSSYVTGITLRVDGAAMT